MVASRSSVMASSRRGDRPAAVALGRACMNVEPAVAIGQIAHAELPGDIGTFGGEIGDHRQVLLADQCCERIRSRAAAPRPWARPGGRRRSAGRQAGGQGPPPDRCRPRSSPAMPADHRLEVGPEGSEPLQNMRSPARQRCGPDPPDCVDKCKRAPSARNQ